MVSRRRACSAEAERRRVVAIIQCRMSSTRLPGKALLDLAGKTVFERVIERVRLARTLDDVWLATSTRADDDALARAAEAAGLRVYRGSLEDVLARFRGAVEASRADVVVRITADDPLLEPRFIDLCIERLIADNLDYTVMTRTTLGAGVEAVAASALFAAAREATDPYDREHVLPFIYRHPERFKIQRLESPIPALARTDLRLTLDTPEDYQRLSEIFDNFRDEKEILLEDIVEFLNGKR